MQKTSKYTNKKISILTLAAVAGLLLVAVFIWWWSQADTDNQNNQTNQINYSKPTEDQVEAGEQAKYASSPEEETAPSLIEQQPENPTRPAGSINITMASSNGDTLSVRTVILDKNASGICELTMSQGPSVVYRKSVGVQMVASNYTCEGFDIDTGSMARGNYTILITYKNNGSTATATEAVTL